MSKLFFLINGLFMCILTRNVISTDEHLKAKDIIFQAEAELLFPFSQLPRVVKFALIAQSFRTDRKTSYEK